MKEIGGYFGLEDLISNEYYKDLISLNTGRNALLYLVKLKSIAKLYIPYYICDAVTNTLINHKINFEFYNIDSNLKPIFNEELKENEYLYIVNYFGQISNEEINKYKLNFENVIIDNTHAFFQRPIKGVDTIYTCRKFFGVPDGAYLATDLKNKLDLEVDISADRMSHVLGRYEKTASEYYGEFVKNDESFSSEKIKKMSKITHNILGAIDYDKCKINRYLNCKKLHEGLGQYNLLHIKVPEGAFSYPLYLEKGSSIKKELIKHKIFVPTLWQNVLEDMDKNSLEYKYADNIIAVPCDQRYNIEDMNRIVDIIKDLINKYNLHN